MPTLRLLHGPVLLLLYQVAPLPVAPDSLGRYRITAAYGGGQWENAEFSCDGQLLSSTPVRYRSAGAQIDAWPQPDLRLTAFAGTTTTHVGATDGESADIKDYEGPFGGAQLAYEGQRFGVGMGLTSLSGTDGFTGPSLYLRIGDRDHAHFRFERLAPNPAFPTTGWARFGVGFNKGHLRGRSGFFGVAAGPEDYRGKVALAGELGFPIARRLRSQVQVLVGPGERTTQWNVGLGLGYDFGRQ